MSLSFELNNSIEKILSLNSSFSNSNSKKSKPSDPIFKQKKIKNLSQENSFRKDQKKLISAKNESLEMVLWNRDQTKSLFNFYIDNSDRKSTLRNSN